MFRVLKSQWLAPKVRRLEVEAPRVAARHRPGHFVIVRAYEGGERVPLTIADSDPRRGTITLVIQAIGATTERLCSLQAGDSLPDVVGPLGKATEIEHFGHVVLVGGGVGTAVIYPQAGALKAKGNRVTAVIGGRAREYVILEQELAAICDAVYPCTDDGSYGYRGFVTGKLTDVTVTPGAGKTASAVCGRGLHLHAETAGGGAGGTGVDRAGSETWRAQRGAFWQRPV